MLEAVLLPSLQHGATSWLVSGKVSGLGIAAAAQLGKKETVVKLDLGGPCEIFPSTSLTGLTGGPKAFSPCGL